MQNRQDFQEDLMELLWVKIVEHFFFPQTMFMRKQTWGKHDLKRFHINSTKQSFRQNMWRFELVMLWYIGRGWIQLWLCTVATQNSKPYPPSIKFGHALDIPWFLNVLHSCYQCKHLYVKAFCQTLKFSLGDLLNHNFPLLDISHTLLGGRGGLLEGDL
jgi:hypothetical protein